ncbi:MAG: hypothetical protein IKB90_08080 [Alistipes sp.]|nr:hypothetical protein [Alistipes sp.]
MEVKARLQRALQILEDAERVGMLSDIERDILLTELREAYAELKYSDERRETKDERQSNVEEESVVEKSVEESVVELPIAPIAPITPTEEEQDEEQEETEPEVEVELIFNEEEDEETENGELKTENGKRKTENEEVAESSEKIEESSEEIVAVAETPITPKTPITPIEEPVAESVAEEPAATEELAVEKDELSSFVSRHSSKSALLSLYEDAPTPVLGEQFHESPSVADTIACPKGVAESAPVASLREAIGLADKFMLIRELFDGNAEEYDNAITTLDKQPSFDDCIIYISENYTWSPNAQATKLVMELLQRKYN